jgi:hypothetical protein
MLHVRGSLLAHPWLLLVPGMLPRNLPHVSHRGAFVPTPQHSVLALRVEVMRVTQRTAISWTLLEMMVVTRGTLAVMMRWLAVFLLFLGSLGVCLPNSLGTEPSVSGYS